MKYFEIQIFMLFLHAIADLIHPLSNNRSSIGMLGCYSPKMAKLQPAAYLVYLFARTVSHLRPMVLGIQQFALNGEARNGVPFVL